MKRLFAEFVGTFTLVFVGVGAILNKADLTGVALAHGLAIAVMVSAFAGTSDAHFNPAVSFGFLVIKRISFTTFIEYVLAQLVGASVAALALNYLFGSGTGLGLPTVASTINTTQAVIAEAITTALLVLTIFGVAVDRRGTFDGVAGMPIGLIITASIFAIGPLTGAALNPARWFGPAVIDGNWINSWVYIVGPCVGGVIAAIAYQMIAKPKR